MEWLLVEDTEHTSLRLVEEDVVTPLSSLLLLPFFCSLFLFSFLFSSLCISSLLFLKKRLDASLFPLKAIEELGLKAGVVKSGEGKELGDEDENKMKFIV